VHVLRRRQAGAEVKELPDPRLGGQIADHAGEEGAARPGRLHRLREDLDGLRGGVAVGLVVVFAAQPVVVDTGRMRNRWIDRRRFRHAVDLMGGTTVRSIKKI
jgi:hypothetical protein